MTTDIPVRIFDTTLRDGEQAPGAGLTVAEKLEVARQLVRLNVDVIEAGFPAASPGDFEAVSASRRRRRGSRSPALARCRDGDPQRASRRSAGRGPHLHVFIATSDIHLDHKLRMSREEVLAEAVQWVSYGARGARPGRRDRVQRRGRDAAATTSSCCEVYEAVVDAGATTSTSPTRSATRSPPSSGADRARRRARGSRASSASTATTTSASRRPTRSPRSRPAPARSR